MTGSNNFFSEKAYTSAYDTSDGSNASEAPDTSMDYQSLRKVDCNHVWHHLTQHAQYKQQSPMMIVEGKGAWVSDSEGNRYLDATSGGVWTTNIGYGREEMAQAIAKQLVKMPYFAGALATEPGAKLAKQLADLLPDLPRIYYASSGSEANEKAYKIVRQLSHYPARKGKRKILYRDRDYHGSTFGAMSSTGHDERTAQFGPLLTDFVKVPHCCCYRCPFGKTPQHCDIECAQAVEDIIQREGPETVGALVIESITAGGGVIVPVPDYLPRVAQICKKYDVYLHIDEVVTGMGRTGQWFGFQHYGITPDMVTLAKGLASGYAAISVLATSAEIFEAFKSNPDDRLSYFRDISTFGGCASGPVAASTNIAIIAREQLVQNASEVGEYLLQSLQTLGEKHEVIGDIRGKGLFAGIELVVDRKRKTPASEAYLAQIVAHCLAIGVMIGRSNRSVTGLNNVLLICPPLIVTRSDVDKIVAAVDDALTQLPAS